MMLWLLKLVYRPLLRRSALQILQGRLLDPEQPERGRWLRQDVRSYLRDVWRRVDELVPEARLDELPNLGNRHNVFLAVVTTAAYQVMIERDIERDYACTLTADVGWKIYGWMLSLVALPIRITTRDRRKRMERVLKALMVFPFSAPGAPGYEVRAWSEGDRFYTHWTHCPPQAFVRRLVEQGVDNGELEAFYRSWCLYDWAGADLLANDDAHGHYQRTHTLSRGHSLCDMCWRARSESEGAQNPRGKRNTRPSG